MTMLATLAAMAGISTFAATANAAELDADLFSLDSEEVDVTDGEVVWDFSNGLMRPRITGTLVVEDLDDSCAHLVIDYYDGDTFLDSDTTIDRCPEDDERDEWNVNRSGVENALTDRVVLRVEKLRFGVWEQQAETDVTVQTRNDDFTVLANDIFIGGTGWTGTEPFNDADIHWNLDQGLVTPSVHARLHMDNMGGDCGRIQARFLTDSGDFIAARAGSRQCPADNDHYDWEADIPAYSSGLIGQVEVVAQTRGGGQWNDAGSTTLSIEE
jgi:hypothetical protein